MNRPPDIFFDHSDPDETSASLTPSVAPSVFADAPEPMVRSGVFSIFDQGIVSGTNFLTTLLIARACSQDELGVYSLAWMIVLFLAAVQGNLVCVPYTMYCHHRSADSLAEYTGSTMAHQLIISMGAMLCFLGLSLWLSLGVGPEGLRSAAWVLLGVIPFILLRDYARRFSFAHLALGTAVAVDIGVAVLQLGSLLVLWWFGWLSAATGYGVMGAACAVACLGWWLLKKPSIRFSRRGFTRDWRQNWSFGRWALTGQITGLAFYCLPWLLALARSEAETGELAACTSLVGLSNLFVTGLNNFLMPKAAQAFFQRGVRALGSVLRKALLWSMVVLGSLCLFVYFFGSFLAQTLYGPAYADTGLLINVLALATLTDSLGLMASTGLWAMDHPAANFGGDLVQMLVTLAVAFWFVFPFGAVGVATALVIGRASGAAVRWSVLVGVMARGHRKSVTV